MGAFEQFVQAISWKMETPPSFGLFHLISVLLMIGTTVFLCMKFKDAQDKTMRRIALVSWIIILVLEIYKQLVFSYEDNVWDYQWYSFPFQLCSMPLYVLPFIAFMKESKFRDGMMAFMSTFSFFGGLIVFIYPNDVFCELTGVNVQTMVHHGLQLVLGIFFFVYNRRKLNLEYFLRAIPVFLVCSGIAIILNEIMYAIITANAMDDVFNMFYISTYYPNHLPILSTVYALVPGFLFIIIYILGFILAGGLMHYSMVGIRALSNKISKSIRKNA